jgi:hypothetical protein
MGLHYRTLVSLEERRLRKAQAFGCSFSLALRSVLVCEGALTQLGR